MNATFDYNGFELIKPTLALIAYHRELYAKESKQLAEAKASKDFAGPVAMAPGKVNPAYERLQNLEQSVNVRKASIARAELWLIEFAREQHVDYHLTEADLAFLYLPRVEKALAAHLESTASPKSEP
jgi:hypothetical protein